MELSFLPVETPSDFPVVIEKHTNHKRHSGCSFHRHEGPEFYYVISGGIRLLTGGESKWIKQGDVAFINWCKPHRSVEFLDNTIHYVLQIDMNNPIFGGI